MGKIKNIRIEKLENLEKAIADLEGLSIPFNIIMDCFKPIKDWLKEELGS